MERAGRQVQTAKKKWRYQEVYQYVLDLIVEGGLQPGDRLPSASELIARTKVSLTSVRRALTELENEGTVTRHQGLGTFVAHNRIVTAPYRSDAVLRSLVGRKPSPEVHTELLNIAVGAATKNLAAALSIDKGEPVWEVRRLRHINSAAPILERAVLPVARVPALDEAFLRSGNSMYAYLENKYGLHAAATEQAIQEDYPSQEEQRLLGLDNTAIVVRIRGISFDTSGSAFDCYEQVYGAMSFIFYVASVDRRELLQPGTTGNWLVEPIGEPRGHLSGVGPSLHKQVQS